MLTSIPHHQADLDRLGMLAAEDFAALLRRYRELQRERDAYRELLRLALAQSHDLTREVARLRAARRAATMTTTTRRAAA